MKTPARASVAWYWLARLAALVAAVVGLLTLIAFDGRRGYWFELTTHFRVQYFWLLALSTLALAVCRWRAVALASAVLAAVNLALILPLYIGPAPTKTKGPALRALSQNVYWLNRDYGRVLELVRRESPDFVLLLEVTPGWTAALKELEQEYPYGRSLATSDSGGIAFYSRLPLVEPPLARPYHLPAIVARLVTEQGPVVIVGVHPASPSSSQHFADRNVELAALAKLARRQRDGGAVVMLGDMNTTSWSPYFQDMLRESGLADSRRGFGVEPTWPALPAPLRIPIDHCLVSPDVAVINRRVAGAVGSDHRGIIVDFSLVAP